MKTVFFDVDTQIDFLFPAGALYVPGAETLIPIIANLNRSAGTLISTVDAHSEDDPEFKMYPPHCVVGTLGQRKPSETLVPGQIIVEKQSVNCFAAPALPGLLAELNADRYVVYGVVSEICVMHAALGLLKTGKPVEIVADAVKALNEASAKTFFADFQAAGGRLITSRDLF